MLDRDYDMDTELYLDEDALLQKIQNAYQIYKCSEGVVNNATDDYCTYKIGRLGMAFAKHELLSLLEEARAKGIEWNGQHCFYNRS